MLNDDIKTKVLQDIVFLQCAGLRPVVVHGGGPEITAMLGKAGKKTQLSVVCALLTQNPSG